MEKIKIGNRGSKPHESSFWKSALYGTICAALLSLVLLLFFSFLSYKSADPSKRLLLFSYVTLAIASLFCGFSSARAGRKQGLLLGMMSGVLFLSLLIVVSFFFRDASFPFGKALLIYIAVLLLSTLGGIFGGRTRKQRRRIKRQ